jgi:putative ABC transport system substrate-binding protein
LILRRSSPVNGQMQLRRRDLLVLLGGATAWPVAVRAQRQRPSVPPRIAFLGAESPATNGHFLDAFREGLKEHGYIDGHNIALTDRWAEGRSERFPELMTELIGLKPDVILAVSLPAALAAKNETTTIPTVFIAADPLGSGLVDSLARPGGNLTGLSLFLGDEFSSKWLELLKQAVPNAVRVGVLWNPLNPASSYYVAVLREAAQSLGVVLQPTAASEPDQFENAFAVLVNGGTQALVVLVDPLIVRYRQRIVDLTIKHRLPAMFGFREFADAGGLMAYGAHIPELCRRAAIYVDKVLKGAKPYDLPVEQAAKFELVINAHTASLLGLTIPPMLAVFADEVIE